MTRKSVGWIALSSEVNGVANAVAATQTSINFTSTHTYINLRAGVASITLDFFSPVSPSNFVRQSLPYSYLTVSVSAPSAVPLALFSGWDDSWCGFSGALEASVKTGTDDSTVYFNISDPSQTLFTENNNMAAWGSFVAGSKPTTGATMSYQYNTRSTVQQAFVSNGQLGNSATSYTAGSLFGVAHNFGTATTASATWAVGWDRAQAVNFMGNAYAGYYFSQYDAPASAVPAFLADYLAALAESLALDARVLAAGRAFSTNYADLLEQSLRQIYGAMDLVIPFSTLNTSSPLVFLKEISSDGDIQTVDVIFPTFPALYVLSPDWIKMTIEPYLIYIAAGDWPEAYIPHDLGNYPNALGRTPAAEEDIFVEATGPFLVLIYAYMHATSANPSWLSSYRTVLTNAGDWLVTNGLFPASQLSTVDAIAATANQTGLATSAAVGLSALGKILGLANYTNEASAFARQIYTNGLGLDSKTNPTHLTYNYGLSSSWVTAFHLFPDALLDLNTFPSGAAALEAAWYKQKYTDLASVSGGVLFSYQVDFQISEWAVWAGAVSDKYAGSDGVGALAVAAVHKFVTNGLNSVPFPTKFIVSGSSGIGTFVVNKARPTVGSMWGCWL